MSFFTKLIEKQLSESQIAIDKYSTFILKNQKDLIITPHFALTITNQELQVVIYHSINSGERVVSRMSYRLDSPNLSDVIIDLIRFHKSHYE